MKTFCYTSLVLSVLLSAVACGNSLEDRLSGRWVAKMDAETQVTEDSGKQGLARTLRNALKSAARSGQAELVLRADGSGSRTMGALGIHTTEEGFWRVKEREDGAVTLVLSPDEDFTQFEEWTIRWVDDDRFSTHVGALGEVVFERQSNESRAQR